MFKTAVRRIPRPTPRTVVSLLVLLLASCGITAAATDPPAHVLMITVDTLRADRLSAYGYQRNTTPNIDRLMHQGVRFGQARTVEPLTAPSLASMLLSRYPHEHGCSRNGLRMRSGLDSLPKLLRREGYVAAAFVGNWTLKDKVSGLAEHFDEFEPLLTRKRWLGLISSETTADDLTETSLSWIQNHLRSSAKPFFLWVHYVEPHAPYRLQKDHLDVIGQQGKRRNVPPQDRYDTEVAFVDHSIGELLSGLQSTAAGSRTLILFASDHGESLGEHNYWGHGRHLYEPNLHIPMSITWPGRIEPRVIDAPALNLDLAPTVAELLGFEIPEEFRGFNWKPVFEGAVPPMERTTRHQAHRGAVLSRHNSELARRSGLLEVAVVQHGFKEIFRIENRRHRRYDLNVDPLELEDLTRNKADPTEGLQDWMRVVYRGLHSLDDSVPQPLDQESIERLRSLGYAD